MTSVEQAASHQTPRAALNRRAIRRRTFTAGALALAAGPSGSFGSSRTALAVKTATAN